MLTNSLKGGSLLGLCSLKKIEEYASVLLIHCKMAQSLWSIFNIWGLLDRMSLHGSLSLVGDMVTNRLRKICRSALCFLVLLFEP